MSERYYSAVSSPAPSLRKLRRNSAPSVDSLSERSFDARLSQSIFSSSSKILNSPAPAPAPAPSPSSSSSLRAARTHQHRLNAAQEQRMYHDSCQRLLAHISSVIGLCDELRNANKHRFPIQYPILHRSLYHRDAFHSDTASQPDASVLNAVRQSASSLVKQDFSVLNLNVKLGHATTDLCTLEKQTISNLLDDKLAQCLRHLDNLRARVSDTSSKVLVTGDLNSGKSTLVNALLKRDLLPADQQPCTSMFCEVLDVTLNDGVEQVHAIPNVESYNRLDPSTYHVIEMRHLYKVITDQNDYYKMLKIYARDCRSAQESLLHNGVVDIALIDSPGLNTDSVKTTAVFARQEEIDVVVFVVSAENHFTLSGKEFLVNAANEKTHIFIVVNRFDAIRDKDRCKRLVLEQIRQLSPATYANADDLVHFVSAGTVDLEPGSRKLDAPEFARLEQRLRAFVLENRTQSKLSPAKNYMLNLLSDIEGLSEANREMAISEYERATQELENDLPAYQNLLRVRDRVLSQIEKVAESAAASIQQHTVNRLNSAVEQIHKTVHSIEYPGILLIWQYAQDLADSMSQKLLKEVRQLETHAREKTDEAVERIHEMGVEHVGVYPRAASVDKMCVKNRDRAVVISVEPTDFFDLMLDEKLSGCALSLGAAMALGGRIMGFRDVMSGVWSVSNNMQNARRLILPVVGVASFGFLVYIVSDMRYAVQRKLVKKFKEAVRDSNYVEAQGRRMARESRKVLRVEGWEIQSRLAKEVELKEQRRNEMQVLASTSQESFRFFASLFEKSHALYEKVASVQTNGLYGHAVAARDERSNKP